MLETRHYLQGFGLHKMISVSSSESTLMIPKSYSDLSKNLSLIDPEQYNRDSGAICGRHEFAFPTVSELIQWNNANDLGRQLGIRGMFIFIDLNDPSKPKALACRAKYFCHKSAYLNIRFKQATSLEQNGGDLIWDISDPKKYCWIQQGMDIKSISWIAQIYKGDKNIDFGGDARRLYETYDMLQFEVPFPECLNLTIADGGTDSALRIFASLVREKTVPDGFSARYPQDKKEYSKLIDYVFQSIKHFLNYVSPITLGGIVDDIKTLTNSLQLGLVGSNASLEKIRNFIFVTMMLNNYNPWASEFESRYFGVNNYGANQLRYDSSEYPQEFIAKHNGDIRQYTALIFDDVMRLACHVFRYSYGVNLPRNQKVTLFEQIQSQRLKDVINKTGMVIKNELLKIDTWETVVTPCIATMVGYELIILKDGDDKISLRGRQILFEAGGGFEFDSEFDRLVRTFNTLSDSKKRSVIVDSFTKIILTENFQTARWVGEMLVAISSLDLTSRPDLPDKDSIIGLLKILNRFNDREVTRSIAKSLHQLSFIPTEDDAVFMDRSEVEAIFAQLDAGH